VCQWKSWNSKNTLTRNISIYSTIHTAHMYGIHQRRLWSYITIKSHLLLRVESCLSETVYNLQSSLKRKIHKTDLYQWALCIFGGNWGRLKIRYLKVS
jgi:hypothetical protein